MPPFTSGVLIRVPLYNSKFISIYRRTNRDESKKLEVKAQDPPITHHSREQ
ncbi:hypothetical protein AB205_0198160 [Aquarana catesbeiana]|uniref:Uncharacterized protein n=1 Tax=Aquarana catesbeiana TaxID=8400 RepID=A0A2G9S0H8_AQUCT|nr:hypothetical protein AB205_0198160 [Aquarana catesbeiana]